jgi:cellobiose phosphorylase
LETLDLNGLGHFDPKSRATFVIESPDLPTGWDYVYQNRKMLLRVDQHGPIYAQVDPPSGIVLFRRDAFQRDSSWLVWLRSHDLKCKAFTNFFRPVLGMPDAEAKPDRIRITYSPAEVEYRVEVEGLRCQTRFFLPDGECAICMQVTVTNLRRKAISLSAIPALRTYVNPAALAPWDKPEWYLKTALLKAKDVGFLTQLLNMNAESDKRRTAVLWSTRQAVRAAEISYEKFVGQGSHESPQAVLDGQLRLKPSDGRRWGEFADSNTLFGYPPINALQYRWMLRPGQSRSFRQVLALVSQGRGGALPKATAGAKFAALLKDAAADRQRARVRKRYDNLMDIRTIRTPDPQINRYVNEWLPLQMDWVCSLDRGWPSGMRGSRDSSNDFIGMVPLNPDWCREIIQTLMGCQRTDGWFPRQYSAMGRHGKHDLREYVDAGCWALELLYEYLCFTKDWALLDAELPWLNSDKPATVWRHARAAMEYFIRPENLGEHGLVKIRGGEWLDSVNCAGLKGRGEAVMTSCQAVIALTYMSSIVEQLAKLNRMARSRARDLLHLYSRKKRELSESLRNHACNRDGYFNGMFNDDGKWIYSNHDPDGVRRVYGGSNWFAIASGVAVPERVDSVLKEMKFLKCPAGYRLLHPPLGRKPIPHLGRGGSGDMPEGLWENGTVYNHGSQGFLCRALAVAGRGDQLLEVMRYLYPFDQKNHPIRSTMTPPYAITNCYQLVPGFMYRGGMLFLTGSIAYGIRAAYDFLLGIRPLPDGLALDPCLPRKFGRVTASFAYLSKRVELTIENPEPVQCGVKIMTLNGRPIRRTRVDPFSLRTVPVADDALFTKPVNRIVVTLG